MTRLQLDVYTDNEAYKAAHGGSDMPSYDKARPWNCVWKRMLADDAWWQKEVRWPGLLLTTRSASVLSLVDGDAPIAGGGRQPPSRDTPNAKRPTPATRATGSHSVNRGGAGLCASFNNGSCTKASAGNTCPHDNTLKHQCSNCLQTGHPAVRCPNNAATNNRKRRPKGKGKGKGKKNKQE